MSRCYCTENTTCDFCNGYRSATVPELHCPRAMKEVAAKLDVTTEDLAQLSADDVRSRVDLGDLRAEVERRYPLVAEDYKRRGLWA